MSKTDKSPDSPERGNQKRKGRKRETKPGEGELVSGAAARLARVENAIKPAPDKTDDTEALRKDLSQKITDHVYYLRAAGESWDTIVHSVEETFGLPEEEIRRTAKKKDSDAKIGQRLAAAIIGQAQILGDASTD